MKRLTLFAGLLATTLVCASDADAQYIRRLVDHCSGAGQQRAIYNANLIAYKMRYTDAWMTNYQNGYRYGYLSHMNRPTTVTRTYYAPSQVRYYATPATYVRRRSY